MKVGVITFSFSKDNYGQILQCYALQEFLKKEGHDPFLIRYQESPQRVDVGFKWKNITKYIVNLSQYIHWYWTQRAIIRNNVEYVKQVDFDKRGFEQFITQHIHVTHVYTKEMIEQDPPQAEAYICGSDQIWGGNWIYYLSFAPEDAIKIAYAPSLGGITSFAPQYEEKMKSLLSRFSRIGMRERSGVETIKRMGFNAEKVIDPTLLLDRNDYAGIVKQSDRSSPYAFVYLLGNPIDLSIVDISSFVASNGWEMVYVASQGRADQFAKLNPTIEEWLGLIAKAEIVITNSFHCVAFSLIFSRPFISIPLSHGFERMNTRISDLLCECKMEAQIQSKELKFIQPDFSTFQLYVAKEQKHSIAFLSILNHNN